LRTFRDAKIMAKILRSELIHRRQVKLSHSECLEIVARQFGHDDWNVMAAKINELSTTSGAGDTGPFSAATTTISVFRVFHVELAQAFYVDFLGFTFDWGGSSGEPGTPFYGQVSRHGTVLHLTEATYDPYPGSTVGIWVRGVDALNEAINARRSRVKILPPAVWVPAPEDEGWARVMTISDPFGNSLRFMEPTDPRERAALADWG
jgi:catechol 2,3-dioxygenase-like lactoylglutathione lyase family enzyme